MISTTRLLLNNRFRNHYHQRRFLFHFSLLENFGYKSYSTTGKIYQYGGKKEKHDNNKSRDTASTRNNFITNTSAFIKEKISNVSINSNTMNESDSSETISVPVEGGHHANIDLSNKSVAASKLKSVINAAQKKLSDNLLDDQKLYVSILVFLQLISQIKNQDPSIRDNIYDQSGSIPIIVDNSASGSKSRKSVDSRSKTLFGIPFPPYGNSSGDNETDRDTNNNEVICNALLEYFYYSDWAYDTDSIELKEKLLSKYNYKLIKHDLTKRPGYVGHFVAINPTNKSAIIAVRGTDSLEDALTDIIATVVPFNLQKDPFHSDSDDQGKSSITVHEGIALSSKRLADDLQPIIEELLLPLGYRITLCGHSLGAGAAALTSLVLRSSIPSLRGDCCSNKMHVYAYACPPVLDYDTSVKCKNFITTIINNSDIIPRCSLNNVEILLETLKRIHNKLEEKNMDLSDISNIGNLLSHLLQDSQKNAQMIMNKDDLIQSLHEIQGVIPIKDPEHLYVPGKVILMYESWKEIQTGNNKEEAMKQEAAYLYEMLLGSMKKNTQKKGSADMFSLSSVKTPNKNKTSQENVTVNARIGDCAMIPLRNIEIDDRMITDHLRKSYCRAINNIAIKASGKN